MNTETATYAASTALDTALAAWAAVNGISRSATRRGERAPLEAIAASATLDAIAATPISAVIAWEAREGQAPQRTVTLLAGGRHYREGLAVLPAALGGYARHRELVALVAKAAALVEWGSPPSFPTSAWGEGNLRYSIGGHQPVAVVAL